MLRLLFLAGTLAATLRVSAATPAALDAALKKGAIDSDHWAFTETTRGTDKDGKPGAETVVRFDPSKPYPEQYTPIKIKGKPPTEKQVEGYRKRGERRAKREDEQAAKKAGDEAELPPSINLNGDKALVALEEATVLEETDTSLTYEVPLRAEGKSHSLPVKKLQLLIRVNKERRELEHATLRLLEGLRVKVVAKISRGEFAADFTKVDPNFPPVMTRMSADIGVSLFFKKRDLVREQKRDEFQRVKPYRDRFGVKVGPLNALPF